MAETTTAPATKIDWAKATEKLDALDKAVQEFAGKPGMNPGMYISRVTAPLRAAVANEKTRDAALFQKVAALQPEEPTVAKFFKNPVK